jgi:hypothetical protein
LTRIWPADIIRYYIFCCCITVTVGNKEQNNMSANWDFDFSVQTATPIVNAVPGESKAIPITVVMLRGNPQPVQLAVATNWGTVGIVAQVTPNMVPGSGMATLHIVVSAATPPGSYMIGVQGTTQGTFKTSEAMVTVVVEPKKETKDKGQQPGEDKSPQTEEPGKTDPAPVASRPSFGKARKASHPSPGRHVMNLIGGLLITAIVLGGLYFLNQEFDLFNFSGLTSTPTTTGTTTYTGTQTFTIYSAMGGNPQSSTGPTRIQIDSTGDVLGPVLFGKITNGVFTGEAKTQDGTVFPMTGTFSNGVLSAQYKSNSVSWVWTVHK